MVTVEEKPLRCLLCGYSRAGLPYGNACPECGFVSDERVVIWEASPVKPIHGSLCLLVPLAFAVVASNYGRRDLFGFPVWAAILSAPILVFFGTCSAFRTRLLLGPLQIGFRSMRRTPVVISLDDFHLCGVSPPEYEVTDTTVRNVLSAALRRFTPEVRHEFDYHLRNRLMRRSWFEGVRDARRLTPPAP